MAIQKLLAALLVSLIGCAAMPLQPGRNDTLRIIGGEYAQEGDIPYIVSIQKRSRHKWFRHKCGGSLLDATTVLTAAHCVEYFRERTSDVSDIIVRVGSLKSTEGGTVIRAKSWSIHPGYVPLVPLEQGMSSDIGIIKLSEPIPSANNSEFAKLAPEGFDPLEGTMMTAAGWGSTTDSPKPKAAVHLRKVNVPLISHEKCVAAYNEFDGHTVIDQSMVCAGFTEDGFYVNDHDSCPGDSGGPLADSDTGILTGIVSFGLPCGAHGAPRVYANIANLREYIDENMG